MTLIVNLLSYPYMNGLIEKIIAGIIGIGISLYFLSEVTSDGQIQTILLVGAATGLLLFFVRPILSLITLPLRIITLNLFSIVIMMFLVWIIDALFPSYQFEISGLNGILFTTLILWGTEKVTSLALK